jgi:MFS family permease
MYLITYMDRANISVTAPAMESEFGLSKIEMGLVFSAFAWAYAVGQIPGGWLADRFGPKKVLLSIVSFWSLMTAMTAWTSGLLSLFSVRFVFGLGEAGAFPTATRAMQLWFPKEERGFIQGVTHCFSRIAVAATPFVAVAIMTAYGWRWVFYSFALLGVVWTIAFAILYRNRPQEHPHVNRPNWLISAVDRQTQRFIPPKNRLCRGGASSPRRTCGTSRQPTSASSMAHISI